MRKNSRALAALLSVAMISTGMSMSTYAVEEEMAPEVMEESAKEAGLQEEEVTGADAEGGSGEALSGEEEAEGQIGDPSKGDTFVVVRDFDELHSAIDAAIPGVETVIQLSGYNPKQENDKGFTISSNAAPIEISSGKSIELRMTGDVKFDPAEIAKLESGEDRGKYDKYPVAKMTIASGARLALGGNGEFWFNIVNEGEFSVNDDVDLFSYNGTVVDNKGSALLAGRDIKGYLCDQAVLNENEMFINCTGDIVGSKYGEKTTENYGILNKKSLLIETSAGIKAEYTAADGIAPGYGIYNDAEGDITVRGASEYDYSDEEYKGIEDIYNKGALKIGSENYSENYSESRIGTVYCVESGSMILHDGLVNYVFMGTDKSYKKTGSGTFTQVGGVVESLTFTDNSVLPVLRHGRVNGFRKLVEKEGFLIEDTAASIKDYKYIGHRIDETDTIEREAYRLFDENKDTGYDVVTEAGEKYLVADKIENGIPYRHGNALYEIDLLPETETAKVQYKPIATVEDLIKYAAAEEGGYYYLVNDEDHADEFVVDKEIKFTAPFFSLVSDYLYDEEKHYVSKSGITVKDGGSLNISADSNVTFTAEINAQNTSNTVVVNEGTFYGRRITADGAKKPVLENKGTARISSVYANLCDDVIIHNASEGTLNLREFRDENAKKTALVNEGKLSVTGLVRQNPFFDTEKDESLKGLTIIENAGEFELKAGGAVTQNTQGGIAVDNKGVFNVSGTVMGNAKDTIAVKNNGSSADLELAGGSICAYRYMEDDDAYKKGAFAIVYTDNEPVLSKGYVYGSRGVKTQYIRAYKEDGTLDLDAEGNEKLESAVYGSAVVKEGDLTNPGEYKTFASGSAVSGKNAGYIENGNVPCSTSVKVNGVYTDEGDIITPRADYLLMEVGESIPVSAANSLDEYGVFTLSINNNTFGVKPETLFEITSNSEAVKIENVSAADFDKDKYGEDEAAKGLKLDVIKAAGTGMATVKAKSIITDSEDYIVIESVKAGEREKIVAGSYVANIAQPNITMNAYQKQITLDVDWHLADYDNVTGAYDMANNFYPVGIYMAEANADAVDLFKYFMAGDFYRDGDTKTYKIDLESRLIDSSDWDYQMPYLVQDGMTKLTDINLVLKVKDVVSKKTFEFPINQKLNISVKQQKPVVKFAKATVNSAYVNGSDEAGFTPALTPASSSFAPLSDVRLNGEVHYFDQTGWRFEYTGPAKGGSFKVPVYAQLRDYYGIYDTTISVSARAAWPKAFLDKKTVTVAEKPGDYTNIPLTIRTANPDDCDAISGVSIVGESSFVIANGWNDYDSYQLSLKPVYDIKGSEKVTLKVYYEGSLKKNKGKRYTSTLKFTVKSLPNGKFKLGNVIIEDPLYVGFADGVSENSTVPVTNQGTIVEWSPVPYDVGYTDTYFVAKSLDGKLLLSDDEGDDYSTGEDDHNGVVTYDTQIYVEAGPALTASDKSASFQVDWYASDGSRMSSSPLIVSVPIQTGEGTVSTLKPVTVDIAKQNVFANTELGKITGRIYYNAGGGYSSDYNADKDRMLDLPDIEEYNDVVALGSTGIKVTNGMHLSTVDYHGAGDLFYIVQSEKKLYVVTDPYALKSGKITPGSTYKLDLSFSSPNSGTVKMPLEVNIAGVKKVKALGTAEDEMSALTSYARARIRVNTLAPFYGLKVKEVRLTGASASMFDITNYTYENESQVDADAVNMGIVNASDYEGGYIPQKYMLTWKDNTVPSGAKNGTVKVTLDVEYTCGAIAKVSVPLTVFGAGVK